MTAASIRATYSTLIRMPVGPADSITAQTITDSAYVTRITQYTTQISYAPSDCDDCQLKKIYNDTAGTVSISTSPVLVVDGSTNATTFSIDTGGFVLLLYVLTNSVTTTGFRVIDSSGLDITYVT